MLDVPVHKGAFEKVHEELKEFTESDPKSKEGFEEFGDLLFAIAQLGRKLNYDVEDALSQACKKFAGRFKQVEQMAGAKIKEMSLDELEILWKKAKLTR